MNVRSLSFFGMVLLMLPASAQRTAPPQSQSADPAAGISLPKFEVTTVRRHDPGDHIIISDAKVDSVMVQNMSIAFLLQQAYGLAEDQISGLPAAMKPERFDIVGKLPEADLPAFSRLSQTKRFLVLRWVLEERFGLKYHYETRQLNAYVITVAKGGPRMKAVEQMMNGRGTELGEGSMSANPGNYRMQAIQVSKLAKALSNQLMRPVLDQTGLTSYYTFTLHWDTMDTASPGGVSLNTAMEDQLGLKLEMKKAPLQVMVVDHIEEPSEN